MSSNNYNPIDTVLFNTDLFLKIKDFHKCRVCEHIQNSTKDLNDGMCYDCIDFIINPPTYGGFKICYKF